MQEKSKNSKKLDNNVLYIIQRYNLAKLKVSSICGFITKFKRKNRIFVKMTIFWPKSAKFF